MPPDTCPNCGVIVPEKARACPGCGADESTGWSEEAQADNLGIPSEEFDYEQFVEEEFGEEKPASAIKPRGVAWLWWVLAIVLLGLMAGWFLHWW